MPEQVLVGEVETGRAATVRRQINKLIAVSNTSDFDLSDLLYETDTKLYYTAWGFESFSKFAKSLALKYTKSYYLLKIKKNMVAAGLEREQYEPVGKTKLRSISRLNPESEFNGTPVNLLIRELTLKAGQMTPEEVNFEVDTIMGLTEDESMVWVNLKVKKLARENVIKPAFEKMKKHLGTQPDPDNEGQYVEASDGRALEMIAANFLADPNYDTPDDSNSSGTIDGYKASLEEAGIAPEIIEAGNSLAQGIIESVKKDFKEAGIAPQEVANDATDAQPGEEVTQG